MSVLLPRKSPRRTALRGLLGGAAVTVGLPFLDCFLDGSGKAIAATGARLPVRFGTWYWGLGLTPNYSIKTKVETSQGIAFLEECKALRPYEKHINYFEGFNTPLDGKGNYTHYSGYCAARTGTAASFSGDIPVPTLDILVADTIGAATRFPTIDVTSVGIPSQNYSARSTNSRAAAEASPAQLYARLFGPEFVDPNKGEFKPDPQVLARHSALSAVLEQSKKLQAAAGASDKARLDEYFTSIRQLENRLALQLEKPPPNQACMIPKAPKSAEEEAERHAGALEVETVHENHRLMSDMLAMAVACNQTNVFNLVFTDNNNVQVYVEDGSEAKVVRGSEVLPCGYQRGKGLPSGQA